MKYTSNYNLKKPEGTDTVNIDDFNNNTDILDTEINSINGQIDTITTQDDLFREQINSFDANKADLVDGKVPEEQLPSIEVPVQSVNNKTGAVVLTKSDVELGNADNTADSVKNVLSATKLATARSINGVPFNGTANITIADGTKAPIAHASTGTEYGIGTPSNYGHVKVRNDLVGTETSGATVSPAQIKTLNDKINNTCTLSSGSGVFTDVINPTSILIKNIPIGSGKQRGRIIFQNIDYNIHLSFVEFSTIKQNSYVSHSMENSYTVCSYSLNPSNGRLSGTSIGTSKIALRDAYINGSNLELTFYNTQDISNFLNTKYSWEVF